MERYCPFRRPQFRILHERQGKLLWAYEELINKINEEETEIDLGNEKIKMVEKDKLWVVIKGNESVYSIVKKGSKWTCTCPGFTSSWS